MFTVRTPTGSRNLIRKSVLLLPVYTQYTPTQGRNLYYDLLPVQYTELTHQLRKILVYRFLAIAHLDSLCKEVRYTGTYNPATNNHVVIVGPELLYTDQYVPPNQLFSPPRHSSICHILFCNPLSC